MPISLCWCTGSGPGAAELQVLWPAASDRCRGSRAVGQNEERRGLVHRYDDVDPRAPSAGSDPEVTAELVDPRLDAADTNAGTKIRTVTLHGTRHTMTVVRDHHVDPTGDPAQLDRHMRCGGVAIDVGQGLLQDAKQRLLRTEREVVDLRAQLETDSKARPTGIPIHVLLH